MQFPLKKIENATRISLESTHELEPKVPSSLQDRMHLLQTSLETVIKSTREAASITGIIQQQLNLFTLEKMKVQAVDITTLIDNCLNKVIEEVAQLYPDFVYNIVKTFDHAAVMLIELPENFAYACSIFFHHAFAAMQAKKEQKGTTPVLEVHTIDHKNSIEVVIRYTGNGKSEQTEKFFQSFLSLAPPDEKADLNLCLAHDIIVHIYQGSLRIEPKEEGYLQFILILPRPKKGSSLSTLV